MKGDDCMIQEISKRITKNSNNNRIKKATLSVFWTMVISFILLIFICIFAYITLPQKEPFISLISVFLVIYMLSSIAFMIMPIADVISDNVDKRNERKKYFDDVFSVTDELKKNKMTDIHIIFAHLKYIYRPNGEVDSIIKQRGIERLLNRKALLEGFEKDQQNNKIVAAYVLVPILTILVTQFVDKKFKDVSTEAITWIVIVILVVAMLVFAYAVWNSFEDEKLDAVKKYELKLIKEKIYNSDYLCSKEDYQATLLRKVIINALYSEKQKTESYEFFERKISEGEEKTLKDLYELIKEEKTKDELNFKINKFGLVELFKEMVCDSTKDKDPV